MQKKTIFMMADGDMPFNGFCALSSLLKENECYKLVIICEKVNNFEQILLRYNLDAEDVEILVYNKNTIIKYGQREVAKCEGGFRNKKKKKWTSIIKRIYEKRNRDISDSIGYLFIQIAREIKRLKREEKIAHDIFFEYSPDILLISTDRNIGLVQSMIYIAKMNKVPRVVAPIAQIALIKNLMNMRYGRKNCEIDEKKINSKRLIEWINPDWVWEYEGKKYIFYQPGVALSGWITKKISLKPWLTGGGDASMVAVLSEDDYVELRTLCKNEDIRKKYVLTKGVEDSIIEDSYRNRESRRKQIVEKYGIEGKQIIIFALPQMYEHKLASWEVCKHNITNIIRALTVSEVDLLISFHPKMARGKYSYIEGMARTHILDEALSSVIGIADIVVVQDECSTKRWTEMLGIDIICIKLEQFCHEMSSNDIQLCIESKENMERNEYEGNAKKDFCDILEEILYAREMCL